MLITIFNWEKKIYTSAKYSSFSLGKVALQSA